MEAHVPQQRTRYSRGTRRTHLVPQERDGLLLADLLKLGFVTTPAATLLFMSLSEDRASRYAYERLKQLHRAGYLTRLPWEHSRALALGGLPDLLTVENGLAGVTADARRPLDTLPPAERANWERLARADKEKVLGLLASVGVDPQHAGRLLRYHGETARALLARTWNTADHAACAATVGAIVLANARWNGLEVQHLLADGEVELAREVVVGTGARTVARKPDLTVVLADRDGADCLLLEAETGTASRGKVAEKVAAYRALIDASGGPEGFRQFVQDAAGVGQLRSARVVFYCQTDRHMQTVRDAIAGVVRQGRAGSFCLVPASLVHLDLPALAVRDNKPDGSGVRPLDRYRTLIQGEVAATVTAHGDQPPTVTWGALVRGRPTA